MLRFPFVSVAIAITGLLLSSCSGTNQDQSTSMPDTTTNENPTIATTEEPQINEEGETINNDYSDLEIITLLPKDAIPAIDDPQFLSTEEVDEEYAPDELILGVEYNGDARAYSINLLSRHEIVNDTVGGVKISVTW
jgi:hypothetical protein